MRGRSSFAYLEPRRIPSPARFELFRSGQLNATGWAALAGLCTVCGAAAYLVARAIGWPGLAAAPVGALAGLTGVVAADRRRWGRMETSYAWADNPDTIVRIGALLRLRGIPVTVQQDWEGLPRLHYRMRDARSIRRALRRLGVPPPPLM